VVKEEGYKELKLPVKKSKLSYYTSSHWRKDSLEMKLEEPKQLNVDEKKRHDGYPF
jgi:hypothetical protein